MASLSPHAMQYTPHGCLSNSDALTTMKSPNVPILASGGSVVLIPVYTSRPRPRDDLTVRSPHGVGKTGGVARVSCVCERRVRGE